MRQEGGSGPPLSRANHPCTDGHHRGVQGQSVHMDVSDTHPCLHTGVSRPLEGRKEGRKCGGGGGLSVSIAPFTHFYTVCSSEAMFRRYAASPPVDNVLTCREGGGVILFPLRLTAEVLMETNRRLFKSGFAPLQRGRVATRCTGRV